MRYVYATLIGIALVVAGTAGWMLKVVGQSTGSTNERVRFAVSQGQQLRNVALALEKERLIVSASAWTLYVLSQGQRSNIQAGDYELNRGMTGRVVLQTLTTSPLKQNEVTVKVLEGTTNAALAALLESQGVISAADFLAAVRVTDSRQVVAKTYGFLSDKPASADLQGYLFPDTYRFFKGSDAATVVQKFLDNFDDRVGSSLRQSAQAQGRTLFEELTMASILEAELKTDADRANGADVFWKRLSIGMALQSDATVNYVTGKGRLQPSINDTKVDSPYNTYVHTGLPPGPINNPSISALRAAINPTSNPYYYYLTKPDGTTVFSKTLEEHNENKAKYLR